MVMGRGEERRGVGEVAAARKQATNWWRGVTNLPTYLPVEDLCRTDLNWIELNADEDEEDDDDIMTFKEL